jgi:hypothetical protein
MIPKFTLDPRAFVKDMTAFSERQVPYAAMKTINETAEDFQAEEQEGVARRFILRRPQFIMNTIKINRGDFATKDNLRAIVRVDPDRDVLSKFEDQGTKEAMFGGHSLAIPIDAKRSKQDIVSAGNRPRALQLINVFSSSSEKIARGIKGTFMIQKPDGSGGIYQRQGSGRGSSIHLLFLLKRKVTIPRSLQFIATAERIVAERLPENWAKWWNEALRTAR